MKILETRRQIVLIVAILVLAATFGYGIFSGQGRAKNNQQNDDLILWADVELTPEHQAYIDNRIALNQAAIVAMESGGDIDLNLYQALAADAYFVGNLVLSRDTYEKYLAVNSINDSIWGSYGTILFEMNDLVAAADAFTQATDLDASVEEHWRDLIAVQKKQGASYKELSDTFNQAVAGVGQTPYLMVEYARLHLENGNCDAMNAHYNVAKTLDPNNESIISEAQSALVECSSK